MENQIFQATIEYNSPRKINIGDVFYKIQPCDFQSFREPCKVCNDTHEVTVNDVTFKCPVCNSGKEMCKVNAFVVKRYRVFEIGCKVRNDNWQADTHKNVYFKLYHKEGRGYWSHGIKMSYKEFFINSNDISKFLNTPSDHYCDFAIYDDYNLACSIAKKFTEEQKEILRKFNEENGTNHEFTQTSVNDKKSK